MKANTLWLVKVWGRGAPGVRVEEAAYVVAPDLPQALERAVVGRSVAAGAGLSITCCPDTLLNPADVVVG